MESWMQEQLEQLTQERDESKLLTAALKMVQQLEFEFISFVMRAPVATSQPKVVMLSNHPSEWLDTYQKLNYVTIDPTVAHCFSSMLPILWQDAVFAETPEFWEQAKSYGLRYGWGLSAHDHRGRASMLSVGRSENAISITEHWEKAGQTYWLCHLLHATLTDKPNELEASSSHLTEREIEVLRWSADGKKAHEIADILNVSERTVTFHVQSAMNKLGAANKTSAVIQAAMRGLL